MDFRDGKKAPEDQFVTIKGQVYLLSPQHQPVVGSEHNPHVRNMLTLPDGIKFSLLYDERNLELLSSAGVPFVAGMTADNEETFFEQVSRIDVKGEAVYCEKRAMGLHFTCGIRVQDGDLSWTANFDEADVQHAPLIRVKAEQVLKDYREAANAKGK